MDIIRASRNSALLEGPAVGRLLQGEEAGQA
jgi:hypothetical protein